MQQIGESVFVDATEEEENCIDSMIFVCVNRRKEIVSIQNQQGKTTLNSLRGSLHIASNIAEDLFKKIDEVIEVFLLIVEMIVQKDDLKWTTNELPTKRGLFVQ